MRFYILSILFFISVSLAYAQSCLEGTEKICGATDIGECKLGIQYCVNGSWTVCFGFKGPVEEICDGEDNDCDNIIDEGCECEEGEIVECGFSNYGICQFGNQTCVNNTWTGCAGAILPGVELCSNNLDDDCDNVINDGCVNVTTGNCLDNVKNGNETGIDCGGNCPKCGNCTDGILDKNEERTGVDIGNGIISDCGGPCGACPSCSDGKRNQNEEGVDCGGSCKNCVKLEDTDDDNDGLVYSLELQAGTDPNNSDTDNDGKNDKIDKEPLCPNTVCDVNYGEDKKNCPEDCKKNGGYGIFVAAFVIIFILGAFFYFYKKFKGSTGNIGKREEKKEIKFDADRFKQLDDGKYKEVDKVDKEIEGALKEAEKYFK